VRGVTQLHDIVYIVCAGFSTILRFNATTHQRLTDIHVDGLNSPWDIVACDETSQVYVIDLQRRGWRMSADGADIKQWLSEPSWIFNPGSLSVTSTRLLVTSGASKQLTQFDAVGVILRQVQLPDYMPPFHAVESPAGTFIVSHYSPQLVQYQVSEVDTDGKVLRQFSGSRMSPISYTRHVTVDSHGSIFVADAHNRRILLLDAQLTLRRVVVEEHELNYRRPLCLWYLERTGQLLVGSFDRVAVFGVLRR